MKAKCFIIGVGANGRASLSAYALQQIESAELLVGGSRHLGYFPEIEAEKLVINASLDKLMEQIRQQMLIKQVVVMASGDPMFYGIARRLLTHLPEEQVEIIPNVSSMQWAFAKLKTSWEDAAFTSVHGRPLEDLLTVIRGKQKIGIFTDASNTPAAIARFLMEWGVPDGKAFVFENLGTDDERLVETRLYQLPDVKSAPLNVLILLFEEPVRLSPWGIGIPDDQFAQRKPVSGLITKSEVRVLSIAKLNLHEMSTVWDIGAGTGSVAIEAARIAWHGKVYAVERDAESVKHIRSNRIKLRSPNVQVLHARAPDGLESLPEPDAVFIGGSGGQIKEILDIVCRRLKPGGHLVLNFATLENLNAAWEFLKDQGFQTEITLVNIGRSQRIQDLTRLMALNPVFILTGIKHTEAN